MKLHISKGEKGPAISRRRLGIALQSLFAGWAALLTLGYLVERPVLLWIGPLLGGPWLPTARLALDCLVLGAGGWAIGYLNPSAAVAGSTLFAVTLCLHDLNPLASIDVPWLFRLAWDALRYAEYRESLAITALNHIVLFGSLLAGAKLGRPAAAPISIFEKS